MKKVDRRKGKGYEEKEKPGKEIYPGICFGWNFAVLFMCGLWIPGVCPKYAGAVSGYGLSGSRYGRGRNIKRN